MQERGNGFPPSESAPNKTFRGDVMRQGAIAQVSWTAPRYESIASVHSPGKKKTGPMPPL